MDHLENKIQPSDSYGFTPANANNLQVRTTQTLKLIQTLQEQEQDLYKQLNVQYGQLNKTSSPTEPSLAPGCYVKLVSGCPRQKNPGIASQAGTAGWPADKWAKDTWGEKYGNSGKNKTICESNRVRDYNGWCGISNAQTKFVVDKNASVVKGGDCDWHYTPHGRIGVNACKKICENRSGCKVYTYGNSLGCRVSKCGSDPGPKPCPADKQCPLTSGYGGKAYTLPNKQTSMSVTEGFAVKDKSTVQPVINKINELSEARRALFTNLQEIYANNQDKISVSRDNTIQQYTTAKIIEDQLNDIKKGISELEGNKYNQLRMVEINKYATDRSQAWSNFYILILYFFIPMFALGAISKFNLIPEMLLSRQNSKNLIFVLMLITAGIALYFIARRFLNITGRDNMDFDEFKTDRDFKKKADSLDAYDEKELDFLQGNVSKNPFKLLGAFDADCLGQNCNKDQSGYQGYSCPKNYPYLRSVKNTNDWWCYTKDGNGCNVKSDMNAPNDGRWGFNKSYPQC
jgi:hypothetical protein